MGDFDHGESRHQSTALVKGDPSTDAPGLADVKLSAIEDPRAKNPPGGLAFLDSLWLLLSQPPDQHRQERVESFVEAIRNYMNQPYEWIYVAEGRANAVFGLAASGEGPTSVPAGSRPADIFTGALFRVAKPTPGVTPHRYERLQRYRQQVVEPAVGPQYLVPQVLVDISDEQAEGMNAQRERSLKSRGQWTEDKAGSRILSGQGMLIQDMRKSRLRDQLALEFKPKWLAQSPIAPVDAKRCRTCAREAYRYNKKAVAGTAARPPACPLGLVSDEPNIVLHTIRTLAPAWSEANHRRLKQAFDRTQILTRLRELQVEGDPGTAMFTHPGDEAFGLAMTLRDCTCFVRMPADPADDGPVEIKLADVDEKNWEEKQHYWQMTHDDLLVNGYYHRREQPPVPTHCMLDLT